MTERRGSMVIAGVILGATLASLLVSPAIAAGSSPRLLLSASTVGMGRSITAQVENLEAYDGANFLVNSNFTTDLRNWSYGGEVGAAGHASMNPNATQGRSKFLQLESHNATKAGSIYVFQSFPVTYGETYRLSYLADDLGPDASGAQFILRERKPGGGTQDAFFTHTLAKTWTQYNQTWTPALSTTTSATLYVRFYVGQAKNSVAGVDDVWLRPAAHLGWSPDQGMITAAKWDQATIQFPKPGRNNIIVDGVRGGTHLFQTNATLQVIDNPPTARLTLLTTNPTSNTPLILDASESGDPDSVTAVRDAYFGNLTGNWTYSAGEVAPLGFAAGREGGDDGLGAMVLHVTNASKTGSIWLRQMVPLANLHPLMFSVHARDGGNVQLYQFIFRESAATGPSNDTLYTFPSTNGVDQVLAGSWTPKTATATRVEVYFRFLLPAGKSDTVAFSHPRILADVALVWLLDGQALPDEHAPLLARTIRQPGHHIATIRLTDDQGLSNQTSVGLDVQSPRVTWNLAGPALAPLGFDASFDASRLTREGNDQLLPSGNFSHGTAGWSFSANEIGGNGSWSVVTTGASHHAHLVAASTKAGSVYLSQNVGHVCVDAPCDFAFDYRSPDAAPMLQVLARTALPRSPQLPNGSVTDKVIRLDPGPEWNRWVGTVRLNNATGSTLSLYMRFTLPANATGSVDFTHIVLRPHFTLSWSVPEGGFPLVADNETMTMRPTSAGTYHVRTNLRDPWGATGDHEATLRVVPIHAYRTVQGDVGLWYNRTGADDLRNVAVLLRSNGTTLWSQPLDGAGLGMGDAASWARGGVLRDRNFLVFPRATDLNAKNATLVFQGPEGEGRFVLNWSQAARGRAENFTTSVQPYQVGPRLILRVQVATADQTAEGLVARVRAGDRILASAPLAGADGRFHGEISLPFSLQAGNYSVEYVVSEAYGAQAVIIADPNVHLQPPNSLAEVGAVLGIAAAGLVGGVALRRKRHRLPPPKQGRSPRAGP